MVTIGMNPMDNSVMTLRRGWLCLIFLFVASPLFASPLEEQVAYYNDPVGAPWRPVKQLLKAFYEGRSYQPAWNQGKAYAMLEAVGEAGKEGLDPQLYGIEEARTALARITGELPPHVEVFLTEIFFRYALHLSQGRLDPAQFYPEWRPVTRNVDLLQCLNNALQTGNFQNSLSLIAPQHPSYKRMKDELALLKEMAAVGINPTRTDQANLIDMLTLFGDLSPDLSDPRAVTEALRLFQWRHGLIPTGKMDRETQRELRVALKERIGQLEINMERWRWLPDEFGTRYIITILPDLMLYVVDDGRTVMSMKTVIGTRKQPSPIFTGAMTYLELNPTWNIPKSIVADEIIPKVRKDPGYLAKKHIRIFRDWTEPSQEIPPQAINWQRIDPEKFPYRMTQDPGVNPLGRIKFMFPNEFDVYLHDSTERHLFKRRLRLYSHGCIRIERPYELALWLLQDGDTWDMERLKREIRRGKRQKIDLPHPIPVYILYLTCWVDGNGLLQFRPDYYGYDVMFREALKKLPASTLPYDSSSP